MHPLRHYYRVLTTLLILVWLVGCQKVTDDPTPASRNLVSSSVLGEYSKEQVLSRVSGLIPNSGALSFLLTHPIKVYRIVYRTKNTDGTEVQASGALVVPNPSDKSLSFPLISEQHGTIFTDADAPSNNGPGSETYTIGSLLSSNGFIVALPDFIGYGVSKNLPHPYQHRASLASTSLDMIRATREFLQQENIKWNQKLMIAGYSLGGYATMALQKKIEEETGNEFNLVASSCGAGAYHSTAFMNYLLNQKTHGIAAYNGLYTMVLSTYNRVYGLNRPMSYYLKEPYAAAVTSNPFGANIPVSFNEAVNETFRKAVNENTDAQFIAAIKDNDIYDWKPRTPTRLYHGTIDQQVFYFNSTNAYDAMKKRGANVELFSIPNKGHGEAIQDFLLGTFTFFSDKR